MSDAGKQRHSRPSLARVWRAGADRSSRRRLLGLFARRYRDAPGRGLLKAVAGSWDEREGELRLRPAGTERLARIRLRPRDKGDRASLFENFFEFDFSGLKALRPALIVDAGAHIGCFSLVAQAFWPDARFVAIEPDADNARLLRINLEANGVIGEAHEKALWRETARLEFRAGKSNSGYLLESSIDRSRPDGDGEGEIASGEHGARTVIVEAVSLGDLLGNRIAEIGLLKLDIEGAEIDVLEAELPRLSKETALFCELHFSDRNRPRFESLLRRHGWEPRLIDEAHPPHTVWVARHRDASRR